MQNIADHVTKTHIFVHPTPWGKSTEYIGANEGSVRFDTADMLDLGINVYRLFGGMSRWPVRHTNDISDTPTIEAVKANPDIIPWDKWDAAMTVPPDNSDYSWAGDTGVWQGNARTIFERLKIAQIRPMIVLRNTDNHYNPVWAPNPPKTPIEWNLWWGYVFATVYWTNVRNDYQIDDWEIHNEADESDLGFKGNQEDYFEFARKTYNAIEYVYQTFLGNRPYRVYAPVSFHRSVWPQAVLAEQPLFFNSMDIHNYDDDIRPYTQQVRTWMTEAGQEDMSLWITEWATCTTSYDDVNVGINQVLKNMIYASQPEKHYVNGTCIFALYGWDTFFDGLVGPNGERRSSYYALRMGIRALQGGRTSFRTISDTDVLTAITTQNANNELFLLIVNSGTAPCVVDVDISALCNNSSGTLWEYSATEYDNIVASPNLANGHLQLSISPQSAVLWSNCPIRSV